MAPKLTSGAIQRILRDEDVQKPIIQILGCKTIEGRGVDRYRVLISDGVTACPFTMLGTHLNHMVINKELEKFTVVQVDKWMCNVVAGNKKVIILLNLTVVASGSQVGDKIGNPVTTSSASSDGSSTSAADAENDTNKVPNSNKSSINGSHETSYGSKQTESFYGSRSSDSMSDSMNVHPISSLTPYQNKWTIRARVTAKAPIRTWSNSRGEGKLFSVTFLDESAEIRATGFNDAVDKFYDLLELNKVYYVSKGTLKTANKNFSSVKNDYEITFNNDTTIIPCEENLSSVPMIQFDFVSIPQIEHIDKDKTIDVIGICKSVGEPQTIITRATNREVVKREIRLVDTSNTEVSLTLWGEEATKFDGSRNPVVAVKGVRVSDFNGRSLSVLSSSTIQINPDVKESHILKGWFEKEGCNIESQSISNRGAAAGGPGGAWKTFAQVSAEKLGMGDKADYFVAKGVVVLVRKENCMYMACPSQDCNKKVIDLNNGMYRCEKCSREYPEFQWRLLLSISLADFTENIWVTCFQEAAEAILGVKAQELGELKGSDDDKFNEIIGEANFKSFVFKLRTKMESFNEESRLKTTVVTANPIEPAVYGRKLLGDIKQLEQSL